MAVAFFKSFNLKIHKMQRVLTSIRMLTLTSRSHNFLIEVGQFTPQKTEGKYDTGQLFLHRIFGYRGVILFPWTARVFDRDALRTKRTHSVVDRFDAPDEDEKESLENSANLVTYYQVLMDARDSYYTRAQNEAVTFLGKKEKNRSLYAIPGLDYVSHEDIQPYYATDLWPIHHKLLDTFLKRETDSDPPYKALDTLKEWQEKNHPWLQLSDVHRETTEKIRVTVIPFYMGWRENTSSHWWRYCIRLENLGEDTVYLRERHWRIFSLSGTLETVRGRGVVGQEPVLSKQLPAFQYSSHVSLQCPAGHMWGTFKMERDDGYAFECKIPAFSLESSVEDSEGHPA